MGHLGEPSGLQGYKVIKLEPAELDRLSDYGHLAVDNGGVLEAKPTDIGAIVHDPGATLNIQRMVTARPSVTPSTRDLRAVKSTRPARSCTDTTCVWRRRAPTESPTRCPTVRLDWTASEPKPAALARGKLDIEVVEGGGGGGGRVAAKAGKPVKPEFRAPAVGWSRRTPPVGRPARAGRVGLGSSGVDALDQRKTGGSHESKAILATGVAIRVRPWRVRASATT